MSIEILGISASPVPNSDTDRLVLQVLEASGLKYEFMKLSDLNVGPQTSKVNDDFPELAKKLQEAKGLVLGGYTAYGTLDALSKAFLERLSSMRDLNSSLEQKYVVTIISGLSKQTREQALKLIAQELLVGNMHQVAQLSIEENVPCVEDQPVWEKANQSGKLLAQSITEEIECWLDYE